VFIKSADEVLLSLTNTRFTTCELVTL